MISRGGSICGDEEHSLEPKTLYLSSIFILVIVPTLYNFLRIK